jgi:small ligand-binding sensory domain FIST
MTSSQFASALSRNHDATAALDEVCARCLEQLRAAPDLALVFLSSHHAAAASALAERLFQRLTPRCLLGGTAESIVGGDTEVEFEPALSLWAARLPKAELLPMHLDFMRTPEGGSIIGWPDQLLGPWPENASMLLIGDPFSFPADYLLQRLNEDQPGVPVVGGMCSAGHQPGMNRLLLQSETFTNGAVAVLMRGEFRMRTVVSQGCRPVGNHLVVTRAQQNVIYQLSGMPAYQRLQEVFETLPTREQRMLAQGLHLGRVVSEYQDRFEQGDFLVRNVIGVDADQGAIAVGDYLRTGQTVQFHIRDAETADAELRQMLARVRQQAGSPPAAGLLFTCNGRGTRLFPQPHHDAAAVQELLGTIPLAGFFAAGELGPIGGSNFLHGFTASLALFD